MAAFFAEVEKSASALLDRKSLSVLHGELQFELGRLVADLGTHEDPGRGSVQSIDVRNEMGSQRGSSLASLGTSSKA
jgi:hypothetical protein